MSENASSGDYINRYVGVTILKYTFNNSRNIPENISITRNRRENDNHWDVDRRTDQILFIETGKFTLARDTGDSYTMRSTERVDMFTISFVVEYSTFFGTRKTNTVTLKVGEDLFGNLKVYDFRGIIN
jgi:methyl coenzyme M reductase subunit D